MRRFFLGLAIASLTASVPMTAMAGDREIADQIISTLKQKQASGSLKGFDIDLSVESGVVTLKGTVANGTQVASVMEAAYGADGVKEVVSEIAIRGKKPHESTVKQASGDVSTKPEPLTIPTLDDEETPSTAVAMPEPPKMEQSVTKVSPQDAAITEQALAKLGEFKSQGKLKNFDLDISTVDAEVWVRGFVANAAQKTLVLQTVQRVPGVAKVVDDLVTSDASSKSSVKPASDTRTVSTPASMPVMSHTAAEPRAFAPSMMASHEGIPVDGGMVMGGGMSGMPTPMPMNMGPSYGAGIPRQDSPQMPGYAWPSYAAYPNYAAVTYPKQYSASAWPYIGPFYPYPQVPLGWRKVALEWDDGLWYLDFTSK